MDIQILEQAGIHYKEGVNRFMGKAEMYEKYMEKFLKDQTFLSFKEAMEEKDYPKAFREAHNLKGVAGNLSFHTLFEEVSQEVEFLRDGKDLPAAEENLQNLIEVYEMTMDAIRRAGE